MIGRVGVGWVRWDRRRRRSDGEGREEAGGEEMIERGEEAEAEDG